MPAQIHRRRTAPHAAPSTKAAQAPEHQRPSTPDAGNAERAASIGPGIEAQASEARAKASDLRKKAEAKLADLKRQANPDLRGMAAWSVMRCELAPMLPKDIEVDEVLATLGFEPATLAGVEGHALRQPADPDRPGLLSIATQEGEKALAEKLNAYTRAKYLVEAPKAAGGLLNRFLGNDEPKHDPKPAMTVMFEAGDTLRDGLSIANDGINGESTKDLSADVATARGLREAGSAKRLNKAATGQGLGGRIANRVFQKTMIKGRNEAWHEGQQGRAQALEVVQAEARASMLTGQAQVEKQSTAQGLSLDKVGIGVVTDSQDQGFAANSLNFYCTTKEGRTVHMKNIGDGVSYSQAAKVESDASEAYTNGELTDKTLESIAQEHGLVLVETKHGWELQRPSRD